jgi:NAD(P)-dependent dehydrogenase (short-subunit alcohol dehydrogenase family)
MDLHLNGKTALVTGSSYGLGLAIATGLAREGVRVTLNGRDIGRLDKARANLVEAVPDAAVTLAVGDVGTSDGVEAVIAAVPDVDILVNNAATSDPSAFDAITDAEWQRYFETNVMSGMRLARHYLPRILKRDHAGRIVFISSESAVEVEPSMLHYSVTKAAVLSLARGLAEMTRGTSVTVNAVLAGPTATEGLDRLAEAASAQMGIDRDTMLAGFFPSIRPTSLLQRFADPEEVARLVVFLASPSSSVTNGAAVRAEGGILRSII